MKPPIEFKLDGSEYIELKNLLKASGLCDTGAIAKHAIEQGQVLVDGAQETRKGRKIRPGQIVSFENKQIKVY
jgi:ribosome-associated protein